MLQSTLMSTAAVDSDQLARRVRDYPRIRAVVEQVVRRLVAALARRGTNHREA
jgi:hypothetical protein